MITDLASTSPRPLLYARAPGIDGRERVAPGLTRAETGQRHDAQPGSAMGAAPGWASLTAAGKVID